MSRRRDRARAEAGNLIRNENPRRQVRLYVCANCHKPLSSTFVEVGGFYYHENCPKIMRPMPKAATQKEKEADTLKRARELGLLLPDKTGAKRLVVPSQLIKAGLVKEKR